ncbi:hypothetical protein cyc_07553 [Cyclospora cayetanensis]|uniref:Uncharacterized protein n=1 Tax=Cyclospora cayetanensis TaxID=88456 RepID=A0A1D3D9F8_9EIME|nr:hypothetical protein cyc_07553 [Cyclospora cayetanensis]
MSVGGPSCVQGPHYRSQCNSKALRDKAQIHMRITSMKFQQSMPLLPLLLRSKQGHPSYTAYVRASGTAVGPPQGPQFYLEGSQSCGTEAAIRPKICREPEEGLFLRGAPRGPLGPLGDLCAYA